MAKTFITSGTGASQTLDAIQNEKVPVYNTRADAEADIANIEEGGIVATKDTGATEKVVDVVEDGNMNPVTSNGVFDFVPLQLKFKKLYQTGGTENFKMYDSKMYLVVATREATACNISLANFFGLNSYVQSILNTDASPVSLSTSGDNLVISIQNWSYITVRIYELI